MKNFRRILYLLTVLTAAAAVWLQISVSGEKLLTMSSSTGRWMAVSYRWVTLAALVLAAGSVLCLVLTGRLRRRTARSAPRQPQKPAGRPAPAAQPAPAPAQPAAPAKPEVPVQPAVSVQQPAAPAQPANSPAPAAPAPSGGKFCQKCGAPRIAGEKFCRQCGARFEP